MISLTLLVNAGGKPVLITNLWLVIYILFSSTNE